MTVRTDQALIQPDGSYLEPQCSICQLPAEHRQEVLELKFKENLSDSRIATRLNLSLRAAGLRTQVRGQIVWNHLRHHTSPEDQTQYALVVATRNLPVTADRLNPASIPPLLEIDSMVVRLVERLSYQVANIEAEQEAVGAMIHSTDSAGKDVVDTKMLTAWLATTKSVLAVYEAIRKVADPRKLVELFLAHILREYTQAMTKRTFEFVQGLARAFEQKAPDDRTLAVLREIISEHGQAFGAKFEDTARFYETQLATLLSRAADGE